MKLRSALLIAALLASLASCTESRPTQGPSTYVPADRQAPRHRKEAIYEIPPENSQVSVRYFGLEQRRDTKLIHLVLAVTNHASSGDLEVDSKDLSVQFANGAQSEAALANPPTIVVEPGGHFGMDLFFPLPKNLNSTSQIPEFNFRWKILGPGFQTAKSTVFNRVRALHGADSYEPMSPLYNVGSGALFGPEYGWW